MKDKEGNNIVDIATQQSQQFGFPNAYFEKLETLHDLARETGFDIPKKLSVAESLLDRV